MNYRDFLTKLLLFGTVLLSFNSFAQVPEKARQWYKKGEFNKAHGIYSAYRKNSLLLAKRIINVNVKDDGIQEIRQHPWY